IRFFFFSSRRRHRRFSRDWSSDVCSSDLQGPALDLDSLREDLTGLTQTPAAPKRQRIDLPGLTDELRTLGSPSTVGERVARAFRSEERRVGKERPLHRRAGPLTVS